ncbi:high-affnity carbon uptake protein hat/hatr [Plakobranchus ocellatus]|uniref:High-affnity carbon uptake protein hat/hatr n=1 Tax=Plakobranchus ocellatus TaxID=259542 RepID=A0AAV4ASM4_9GAST|nr:high-affnity carbon uptake protein hat/hatr [Plakobranchus ocellatus]
MATRNTERSPQEKEAYLNGLEEKYIQKVKNYVSSVKAAISAGSHKTAEEMYDSAVLFLNQDPQDRTRQAGDSQTRNKVQHMKRKLESLNKKVEAVESETIVLPADSMKNSVAIQDLKRLQNFLEQRNQEAAASVEYPPARTAPWPLKEVRQGKTFSAKVSTDWNTLNIVDVQLLPGGRLVLADEENRCIKLFDTEGQHLQTLHCWSDPHRLALINSSSNCHTLAVTLFDYSIDMLEVEDDKIKVKSTLQTSRNYCAVAAVDKQSLAVGYSTGQGIDLINLEGQVLRQISSSVRPLYMYMSKDGGLLCSNKSKTLARIQVDTGTVVFNESVPQAKELSGVAIASDGSILVTGASNRTLHLVSSQGTKAEQLWSVPRGKYSDAKLWSVSLQGNVCVCITGEGTVYIFDCVY